MLITFRVAAGGCFGADDGAGSATALERRAAGLVAACLAPDGFAVG